MQRLRNICISLHTASWHFMGCGTSKYLTQSHGRQPRSRLPQRHTAAVSEEHLGFFLIRVPKLVQFVVVSQQARTSKLVLSFYKSE